MKTIDKFRFTDARAFLSSLSFDALKETKSGIEYERGWDIRLDLSPEDYARWSGSRAQQAAFVAACWWAAVRSLLAQLVAVAVCDVRDHEWEDDGSFANGDTGQDHMRCARCGLSFDHIYY